MSSIKDTGENEFANEFSNIVGKSEESEEEEDKRILKKIKKEISESKGIQNVKLLFLQNIKKINQFIFVYDYIDILKDHFNK